MRTQSHAQVERLNPFSYDTTLGHNDVLVGVTHCSLAKGDVWSGWHAAYVIARERGRTLDDAATDATRHIEGALAARG